MGDLLGEGFVWGGKDQLYAILDRLLKHRDSLFTHLQGKWSDLFGAKLDVLIYDLTSTYFEGQAEEIPKARHGYSRDHRPDCKQVVLALIVTPRQALEQLAGVQMLDVEIPTTDGRLLQLTRYTQPDRAVQLLLQRLGKSLPEQLPPKLISQETLELPKGLCSEDLWGGTPRKPSIFEGQPQKKHPVSKVGLKSSLLNGTTVVFFSAGAGAGAAAGPRACAPSRLGLRP
jgi:hypothetical protein